MRPRNLVRLVGLAALVLASRPASQSSTPPSKPAPPQPPSDCFQLRFAELVGADHKWARVRTGDKWISGCLGAAGKCYAPVWLPC